MSDRVDTTLNKVDFESCSFDLDYCVADGIRTPAAYVVISKIFPQDAYFSGLRQTGLIDS